MKQEDVGSSPALNQVFMLAKIEERPKAPFGFFRYYTTFFSDFLKEFLKNFILFFYEIQHSHSACAVASKSYD